MSQESGLVGRMVGAMIRRSVKSRFHTVYWNPIEPPEPPVVFYANHHGWMDGYVMFHLVTRLKVRCVDWIEEFDAFPLFSRVGGLRLAKGDTLGRAVVIRQTIRQMREGASLVIFPEGELHRPQEVLPLLPGLQTIARRVEGVRFLPVALRYELSLHERPEAWVSVGECHSFCSLEDCRERLVRQLDTSRMQPPGNVLVQGTQDVNERFAWKEKK